MHPLLRHYYTIYITRIYFRPIMRMLRVMAIIQLIRKTISTYKQSTSSSQERKEPYAITVTTLARRYRC